MENDDRFTPDFGGVRFVFASKTKTRYVRIKRPVV